jgi:putative membrane protein
VPESFWENVMAAAVFAGLGVVLFVIAFIILDLLTPGKLWHEIGEKKNTAAAILMGSAAIALGIIVAAAIH